MQIEWLHLNDKLRFLLSFFKLLPKLSSIFTLLLKLICYSHQWFVGLLDLIIEAVERGLKFLLFCVKPVDIELVPVNLLGDIKRYFFGAKHFRGFFLYHHLRDGYLFLLLGLLHLLEVNIHHPLEVLHFGQSPKMLRLLFFEDAVLAGTKGKTSINRVGLHYSWERTGNLIFDLLVLLLLFDGKLVGELFVQLIQLGDSFLRLLLLRFPLFNQFV